MSDETSVGEPEGRLKVSDQLLEFWKNREEWPRDGATCIFLARAVDLVGTARFGTDWVALTDPTLGDARRQRGFVFEELTESLASGALTTYTRAVEGGKFEVASPDVWNTEIFRKRFKYCRINKDGPFQGDNDADDGWYLYLDKGEVDSLIRSRPTAHLRIDDADALPAYLAVLVRTAAALQITSESEALPAKTIDAVFEELALKAGIEKQHISGPVLRYAATFLRPPGAPRTAHKK